MKEVCFNSRTSILLLYLLVSVGLHGQVQPKESAYKLSLRDLIVVTHFDEPNLAAEVRIDGLGQINLPLIGKVSIVGRSLREAELHIASEYKRQEYLKKPEVSVSIKEYGPQEISILGEVEKPGTTALPIEKNNISIVDAISRAGGFTRVAKTDTVQITRVLPSGGKETFVVNVSKIISGKSPKGVQKEHFLVQSGDIIFVPQRLF